MSAVGSLAPERQNHAAGIGLMVFGFLLFSMNDALAKWLAGTYSPAQLLLFRSLFALAILAPVVVRLGWRRFFPLTRPWLQALRLTCATAETFLFYWAVSVLPLADAMTYYLAGPIYVTALAAVFLGEAVGWRRWLAVGIGFIGVLIALGPSSASFGGYALIAFAGSVIYAVYLVTTRVLRGTPDIVMAFWQFVASLVATAVIAPFGWVPVGAATDVLLIGLLGVVALAAILCVNRSLKLAPASVVVPYQNTLIVWACLFGFLFFGDVPGWPLLVGAGIIVAACLYIFFREQRLAPGRDPILVEAP